ncbi:MAG: ATP-grasp domain-containing protein, partial [Verrucomicrobiota bacterium]
TVAALIEFCEAHRIGLIVPTRDGELTWFAEAKAALRDRGISVMVSDRTGLERCLDKLAFGALEGAIPAYERLEDGTAERLVVKERFGAGSQSVGVDLSREEAARRAADMETPIFQPYVKGEEVSVDAYITRDGFPKALVMRTRDVVVNGESQVTSTFEDEALEDAFGTVFESLNLTGHVMVQAILDGSKKIHLIECNPRFGGASTLSVRAGVDSFYWAYLESMGENLAEYPYIRWGEDLTQVRYPEDLVK